MSKTTYPPIDKNGKKLHVGDTVQMGTRKKSPTYVIISIGEHTGAMELMPGMWALPDTLIRVEKAKKN